MNLSKSLILLFALILIAQTKATDVIKHHEIPDKKYIFITKAVWDDFDIFLLKTKNHVSHQLVCGNNPFDDQRMSRIKYFNFYNAHVSDFFLAHGACAELFNYLKTTFEGISEDHPIGIELDIKNSKVLTIVLPDINPYDDGFKNLHPARSPQLGMLPKR